MLQPPALFMRLLRIVAFHGLSPLPFLVATQSQKKVQSRLELQVAVVNRLPHDFVATSLRSVATQEAHHAVSANRNPRPLARALSRTRNPYDQPAPRDFERDRNCTQAPGCKPDPT